MFDEAKFQEYAGGSLIARTPREIEALRASLATLRSIGECLGKKKKKKKKSLGPGGEAQKCGKVEERVIRERREVKRLAGGG